MHAGMYARRVFCVIVTVGLASAIAQPAAAQNPFTINGVVPDTRIAAVPDPVGPRLILPTAPCPFHRMNSHFLRLAKEEDG